MITLFYGPTPNGHKVSIALEEMELPYHVVPLNTFGGRQFEPSYLAISPNAKMPAIIDDEPEDGGDAVSVFESGAILLYLARKASRFLPSDIRARAEVEAWLFWQMAALGPMSGQAGHFIRHSPDDASAYARDRYVREVKRLYAVLDHRLSDREFVATTYSVADMAIHPWIRAHGHFDIELSEFPLLEAWLNRVGERPAVAAAYALGDQYPHRFQELSIDQRRLMFACTAGDMRQAYADQIKPWA